MMTLSLLISRLPDSYPIARYPNPRPGGPRSTSAAPGRAPLFPLPSPPLALRMMPPQVPPDSAAHADEEVSGHQGDHQLQDLLDPRRRLERQGGEREEEHHARNGERRGHRRREHHEHHVQAPRSQPALLFRP